MTHHHTHTTNEAHLKESTAYLPRLLHRQLHGLPLRTPGTSRPVGVGLALYALRGGSVAPRLLLVVFRVVIIVRGGGTPEENREAPGQHGDALGVGVRVTQPTHEQRHRRELRLGRLLGVDHRTVRQGYSNFRICDLRKSFCDLA